MIETERQKGITEVVAAGAHTHSSDWQDFLIWHNRKPISADSLAPLPDDKLDATWTSNNAGVRLVLTRDLRDDWLATVRTTAIQATPNEATIQMNAYERALNDLVEDSDRPDAMQKLDFYRAISAAKDPASNRSLAALSGSLGMDDPFFRLLGKTLSAEQVGGNQ